MEMTRRRRRPIRQHDARVLLSDVLPYELPPSFSNRGMYDFINATRLERVGGTYYARDLGPGTETFLQILLGEKIVFPTKGRGRLELERAKTSRDETIPFQFAIRHRHNDFRALTVPHPRAQVDIVAFYRQFADLMLFYCSRGEYSLRRPTKVARYSLTRDWLFRSKRATTSSVEIVTHEYEWLRSYFTYDRYSNVYKFYDSAEYRLCERKYGYLMRVDIAKCFDSIYTHSIAWATHGHELIKENIRDSRGSFGDSFDRLMQNLNHSETSGITIGSEVSRIFAEIILQSVDREIHARLASDGLRHRVDYEILRYVDDYFVFLANPEKREHVVTEIANALRPFKLHLNASKEEGEHTPWTSALTIAKERTRRLIKACVDRGEKLEVTQEETRVPMPRVRREELVVGYKSVLLDTGASHHDLANYTLARVERATEKVISRSLQTLAAADEVGILELVKHVRATTNALLALVEFTFFAFSGAPRMSPAVKVARIASTVLQYIREPGIPGHDRERVEKALGNEIRIQLVRLARSEPPTATTSTLLDCLSELGEGHILPEEELAQIFHFSPNEKGGYSPPRIMNATLLFSLLLHMRDNSSFERLRAASIAWAVETQARSPRDSERALVALNLLSCPFASNAAKESVLAAYNVVDPTERGAARSSSRSWNVHWENFDLYAAVQQKRLYEVY
ncbi:antiviral reverse transcriptase Drt3b [Agromyces sp. NPDC058136]|uniref:antiviral reverse transcriptase Drt3b n=1 Tax=Agromyces sp. NPDC058136 TaxID=3346354 RepID=UPI0036DBFBA2